MTPTAGVRVLALPVASLYVICSCMPAVFPPADMFGKRVVVNVAFDLAGIVPRVNVFVPKFVICGRIVAPEELSMVLADPPFMLMPVIDTITPVAGALPVFLIAMSTLFETPG